MRIQKKAGAIIIIAFLMLIFSATMSFSIIETTAFNNTSDNLSLYEEQLTLNRQTLSSAEAEEKFVFIGGTPLGIVIKAEGLIVVGTSDITVSGGTVNPLAASDLRRGDVVTEINGKKTDSMFALKQIIEAAGKEGEDLTLTIKRGNEYLFKTVKAVKDIHGQFKIGLMAKEDIGGVGTLTFVTQSGAFAALGHHIADPESGLSSELRNGNVYNIKIDDIVKGESGKAGGLIASVNRLKPSIGTINANTGIGLYGKLKERQTEGKLYKIADFGEAKMGKAQVLTTINGDTPKLYDIDIVKVVSQSSESEKGMVIAVKDKELLEKAGGIVQGMSGSPIVQNGVIIGAVTHVFISDPTRGYAVHSRFMYDRAEQSASVTDSLHKAAA